MMMHRPIDIDAQQDRQRHVLVVDNLLPEMERRHLVDDDERRHENHDAEQREHQRVQYVCGMKIVISLASGVVGYPP